MTETGFYKMVRRDKVKPSQLLALAQVLNVEPNYFGEEFSGGMDLVAQNRTVEEASFGEGVISRLVSEFHQFKMTMEKQLETKDRQLEAKDNQINALLGLLGKLEGGAIRPLYPYFMPTIEAELVQCK